MLLCGFTATWAAQTVIIAPTTNGTVTFSPEAPTPGGTVTLTVTPAEGYKITKNDVEAELIIDPGSAQAPSLMDVTPPNVGVKLELGGEDPADLNASREYTFTMPEAPYSVLVTATFTGIPLFDISVVSGDNGTVAADKSQAAEGEIVTLTITPATGYEIDELYYMNGNEKVTITGTSFQMPAADVEVHATFKAIDYTITVAETQNGTVTAPATANYGDEVVVTVEPATGYELETLTYTVEGAEPVAIENGKFNMPAANVTINATFKAIDYTITVAETQNGTVTAPATAHYGDEVAVTVAPATGYELETLTYTVEGADPVAIEDGKFSMPAANVTINATFKAIDYTITVAETQNGTITAPATAHYGDEVAVTVAPATGYELETLTYTVEGSDPVAIENGKFNMPAANVTINATFKIVGYTITVAETQNGTVTAPATANYGDEVVVTVEPATGYELETLTYTVEGAEPVAIEDGKFSMPAANVTINATFKAIDYTITVAETQNGTVEAPATAHYGDEVTLTIRPAEDYELETLTYTVEGSDPVAIENGKFSMPAANVTINATFKAIEHTYTVVGEPAELFGGDSAWDPNNENGEMTLGDDGLYTWTSEPTFLEGDVKFKVVRDNSYDTSYPADNYVISGLTPGTYTITITFNPETGEITVNVQGSADVYVYGDINDIPFAPNAGVKMTSEDGKVYTATVTTTDKENGYGFFAFTHKLSAEASDWGTANAYRFLAQSNGNFLVNGPTMNVALDMAYNADNAMQIPAGEYTLTVDLENMKLTITGGTQLSYILASGVEGVDYTVINDLAVVDRHQGTKQFFTSDGNDNWITIKGGNFFDDAILMDALKGGYVSGVFSEKNLNPYLTLTVAPEEGDGLEVEPKIYKLSEEFAPKVDEVILVERGYYKASENTLRAYAPGAVQGQSLTIDTSLFDFDFKDGYQYKNIRGVINIKEPWTVPSGINPLEYNYPFQNYKLLVLDADEVDPITGIDDINAEQGVKSVRYFNAAGLESNTPFQGVNIVVKEMIDGSRVTTKVILK